MDVSRVWSCQSHESGPTHWNWTKGEVKRFVTRRDHVHPGGGFLFFWDDEILAN